MNIQNKDIQGPPFPCPECAQDGNKTTFNGRSSLGSHRWSQHGIDGTSTGSVSYKKAKKVTRTSIKRTSRGPYRKSPKTNPLVAMLNNPAQFVSELDVLITDKNEQIASLYTQITAIKNEVELLQRYRSMFPQEGSNLLTVSTEVA